MNVQARCEEKSRTDKSFSLFPLENKIATNIPTTKPGKKTFAKISQRMFSEIMFAFTEVAEMKTKNSDKRSLSSIKSGRLDQMLSRCVINRRQNRELEKHQEKKYFHL